MQNSVNRKKLPKNWMQLAILAMLLVNTLLIGWLYITFRESFPGASTRMSYKQEVALDLADYNYRMARELGVLERPAVKEALAAFNYEVEIALTSDELTQVILDQGRRVQEIVLRESDEYLIEQVLAVIGEDRNVKETTGNILLSLRIADEGISTIPDEFLQSATLFRIEQIIPPGHFSSDRILEIEIVDGVSRLTVPYNPIEHLQTLTEELDSYRLRHHELRVAAGLAEMTGPGVTVKLYDEIGGTTHSAIIHDTDIRDIVNELFGSGALGVSVGGQRLITTSSIRCSGSLIKVDDKLIAVNPVTIEAVGNPELLESGLAIIQTRMKVNRGIQFDITSEDSIKLPAFSRSAN